MIIVILIALISLAGLFMGAKLVADATTVQLAGGVILISLSASVVVTLTTFLLSWGLGW